MSTTTGSWRRPGAPGEAPPARSMWQRYASFLRTPPEMSVSWHDTETGARAWLVINSTRGGAFGGGTRMRIGMSPREVIYLAKAMELKFALSGPAIGGAKTGIDFDPADPRKLRVLERWYRAITPLLRERYGTGGDLNVDEVLEVLPTFERLGLHHPQEGIVRGHIQPDAAGFQRTIERLDRGVAAPVTGTFALDGSTFTVADTITGYGVATAIRRFHELRRGGLDGVRVLLEGFGNVGAACALYLARSGARIVAISDAHSTLIAPEGLATQEVEDLIRRRENKLLPTDHARIQVEHAHAAFWSQPADVFVCAAISESITAATLDALAGSGVRVIACGANQPFREAKIGSTRIAQLADRRFSILPDILSNCGMARTFSYLMESNAQSESDAIFAAVEMTIDVALDEVLRRGDGDTALLAATLGLALDRIGAG